MNKLSFGQRDIWYYQRINKESFAYNVSMAYKIVGEVNEDLLISSMNIVIEKHPIFKSKFYRNSENDIVQEIDENMNIEAKKEYIDRSFDEAEVNILVEKSREPFALDRGDLAHFCIKKYNDNTNVLYINIHHIIFDGMSIEIVLREIKEVYFKLKNNEEYVVRPETAFLEFINEEEKIVEEDKNAFKFWDSFIEKNADKEKTQNIKWGGSNSYVRGVVSKEIKGNLKDAIDDITRVYGISSYAFFLGIYGILIAERKAESNVIVKFPFMNRWNQKYIDAVGHFINMVPVLLNVKPTMDWSEYAKEVQENIYDVLGNAYYPIQKIIKEKGVEFNGQNILYYQNWTETLARNNDSGDLKFVHIPEIFQEGEFDEVFEIIELKDRYNIKVRFNKNNYEETIEEIIISQFVSIIEEIVKRPQISIRDIFQEEEKTKIEQANSDDLSNELNVRVSDLIYNAAQKYPEKNAIICGKEVISYKELLEKIDKIAGFLHENDVKSGDKVGVLMPRSIDLIALLIAIMKVDAIYIPIDEMYPSERIEYMIRDSSMEYLISDSKILEKIDIDESVRLLDYNNSRNYTGELVQDENKLNDIVYILYTSGSTGNPKGVQIYHKSLVNALQSFSVKPGFSEKDSIYSVTTVCFDIAELEMFLPLINGGVLEFASKEEINNLKLLKESIMKSNATVLQATPAFFKSIGIDTIAKKDMRIWCGGEAMSMELASEILNNGLELWNMYGPTETTIWSSVFKVTDANNILLGEPIANTRFYILDENRNPVKTGERGELYIAGDGVAKGYFGKEELSKNKFIENICGEEKAYATGDIVKINEKFGIEFCGRKDTQVKIRGYRIELGEIEKNLDKLEEIDTSIAVIRTGNNGNKYITAFLKLLDNITDYEITKRISKWLPQYMIPVKFVRVNDFPKTLNQKYDRQALENMEIKEILINYGSSFSEKDVEEDEDLKKKIKVYIQNNLKQQEEVEGDSNIAEYGYDSILFTDLADYINSIGNYNIDPTFFYKYSTINQIVDELNKKNGIIEESVDHEKKSLQDENDEIVIVGMSGRFPKSDDINEFWKNLKQGNDLISDIPKSRWDWEAIYDESNTRYGGFIDGINYFDESFFGISPREARQMDPQQKLMIQSIWETIEDSGHKMSELKGSDMGVFIGTTGADFMGEAKGIDGYTLTGMAKCIIPNRISYLFDWHGPSEPIDTACSSSLVALHRAVQAIKDGECSYAVVGGVNVMLSPFTTIVSNRLGMLNPKGKCMVFDESAAGYVRSEGVGSVYLKKKKDAIRDNDHIYAIIKGSMVNHGGRATSLTAPNELAQSELIVKTIKKSGVDASQISYIETHGTGTPLGDPIEINGIKNAFEILLDDKKKYTTCYLGSVKSNVGHLEAAAGMVSLIKVLLSIKNKYLPRNINYSKQNKYINLENTHLQILRNGVEWNPTDYKGNQIPRIAAISSFGFGGVNAHVILEEYKEEITVEQKREEEYQIVLSAKNLDSLKQYECKLSKYLSENPNIKMRDVEFTLNNGREEFEKKEIFLVSGKEEFEKKLEESAETNEIQDGKSIISRKREGGKRISLPTYSFKKTECWYIERVFGGYASIIEDHLVHGRAIVPAAVQIENGINYLSTKYNTEISELCDISFYRNVLFDNVNELELTWDEEKKELTYKNGKELYTQLYVSDSKQDNQIGRIQIDKIKSSLTQFRTGKECYEFFGLFGFKYGKSLRIIDKIWFAEKAALSHLYAGGAKSEEPYALSSMIIDGALQTTLVLLDSGENVNNNNYFPYYIENVKIYKPIKNECMVYVEEKKSNNEIKKYDIYICSMGGEIIAEIKGYVIKKAIEKEIVYLVEKQKETNNLEGNMEEHPEYFEISLNSDTSIVLKEAIERGINNFVCVVEKEFNLSKMFCMLRDFSSIKKYVRLLIIGRTETDSNIDKVYFESLKGIIRTLRIENPLVDVSLVETKEKSNSKMELNEIISNELVKGKSDFILYDGRNRKEFVFEEIEKINKQDETICKDDVVFIVGCGEIALTVAKHINQKYGARIILAGRRSSHKHKMTKKWGEEYTYYQADITQQESIQQVVSDIITRYGRIDIVINCAGIIDDKFMLFKSVNDFERILAPKVTGILNLDRVLAEVDLKFFIVFGSISGIVGNEGQCDYAYANSFVNSFVIYRNELMKNGLRKGKSIAINYSNWKNGGMKVDEKKQKMIHRMWGADLIDDEIGMKIFDEALSGSLESVIPLYGNSKKIRAEFIKG